MKADSLTQGRPTAKRSGPGTSASLVTLKRSMRLATRQICQTANGVPVLLGMFAITCLLLSLPTASAFQEANSERSDSPVEKFVPADQLDAVLQGSPSGVMLPRQQFEDLVRKAEIARQKAKDIPAAVIIRQASYEVSPENNHAIVRLSLDIEQYTQQWAMLPIPIGNLAVEQATVNGGPATVGMQSEQPGILFLAHSQPGRFTLELQLSTPLAQVGSDSLAAFRLVNSVPATLSVKCPEDQVLELNGLQLKRPSPIETSTSYQLPVSGKESVQLRWTMQKQQSKTQSLIFAFSEARVRLSSNNLRWNSSTRVSVFGDTLSQLVIKLSAQTEVTNVESAGLESWKLEADPDNASQTRLLLNYRQPFRNDRMVSISAVAALETDTGSQVPAMQFIGVNAHTGRLFVSHEDQLRLMARTERGVRHLGTEIHEDSTPGGEVFDFWLQDYQLSVAVRPRQRELFVEVNSSFSVRDTAATFEAQVTIETLNDSLFVVPLTLPPQWHIESLLNSDGTNLSWRSHDEPGQIVVDPPAPIPAGGLFTFTATLGRTISDPQTEQVLDLPVISVHNAQLVGGTYKVTAAPDLSVAPTQVTGLSPIGSEANVLLFETQGTTYSAKLAISRKPVRMASRSQIRSWMDTRQKTTEATITIDITNGTTKELNLSVSESLGQDLRFEVLSVTQVPGVRQQLVPASVSIIEQSASEVLDGLRTFRLTLDKRCLGSLTLNTVIQQPRSEATSLTAPIVKADGATKQHGLIVFDAYPEQQLSAAGNVQTNGLTQADAGLVPAPPTHTGRRTALVYRFIQPDYELAINERRFDTAGVPTAVCDHISDISVLSETGSIQRSTRLSLRSVGVQTLRFSLPKDEQTHLWSTILNGEAVEVRQDGDHYLVALPTGSKETLNELEVLFESTHADTSAMGRMSQNSVQLWIDSEDDNPQPIDILQRTWNVRYPATSLLIDYDGGFHPAGEAQKPGWLQQLTSFVRIPATREAFRRLFPVGFIGLALFVLTTLIIRRRWKSLMALCVVVIVTYPVLMMIRPGGGFTGSSMARYATDSILYSAGEASGDLSVVDQMAATRAPAEQLPGRGETADYDIDAEVQEELADSSPKSRSIRRELSEQRRLQRSGGAQFGRGGPGSPFGGGSAGGFGAGGFGGRPESDAASLVPGVDPFADGMAQRDKADQSEQAGQGQPVPLAPPAINAPQSQSITLGDVAATTQPAGENQAETLQSDFFGMTDEQLAAELAPATTNERGSARLSIQADVADPADFQTMEFYSIGGTSQAGTLQIVVQQQSQLNAVRVISAGCLLLICVWMSASTFRRKVTFAVLVLLISAGSTPLLPNQWQPITDGLVAGMVAGIILWLGLGAVHGCSKTVATCIKNGCCRWMNPSKSTATGVFLLILLTGSKLVLAAPQSESDNVRPSAILPYTPGRPELLAERVYLPKDDFLKLYTQAYPEELNSQPTPPNNGVVAAFYRGSDLTQVRNSTWSQSFTVRYVIRSFSSQPTDIPLPLGIVAVKSARLNGAEAIVTVHTPSIAAKTNEPSTQNLQQQAQSETTLPKLQEDATYQVRIPSQGLHVLDIEFSVSANIEKSTGRIRVPVRPVSAGTAQFDLPEDNLEVRVNGRSNTYRQADKQLTIPIASLDQLTIEWHPQSSKVETTTVFHADIKTALTIDDTGLSSLSSINIACRQGGLSELNIAVPEDYAVQQIEGADIAGWSRPKDQLDQVKVLFRQAVESSTQITLRLFRRQVFTTESTDISVPVPTILGASRDSGYVTVIAGRELEVRVNTLSGVTQLNTGDSVLPDGIDQNARRVLAWRYTRQPIAIDVRVFRATDRMQITMLNGVQLESQRQVWTSLLTANIAGEPRRHLEVVVPANFLALDVSANELKDWYFSESGDGETRILNLQFVSAQTGVVNAVIQGQQDRVGTSTEATLQVPTIRGANTVNCQLCIWLDQATEIASTDAPDWKRSGNGEATIDQRLRQLQADSPDISFNTTKTSPGRVTLGLRQAVPSLVAESVMVTNVTDTSLELTLGLNWQIARAATRQLSFSLPAQLAEVFDFRISGLRQLSVSEPIDGRINYTVHLQHPVSEQFFILATGTLALPPDSQIAAAAPRFMSDSATSSAISSQSHYWVIVNQSQGLLEPVSAQEDGADVAADTLKTTIPEGFLQQSVAIRKLSDDKPVSKWKISFPTRQQVAPAIVALAAHTTVISEDATWRSRHELQVRNESRQFLPVAIPEGSRFLYSLVNGVPARVLTSTEDERTLHLIPIPQSGELSTPFEVEFALSGKLTLTNDALQIAARNLSLPAPEFPEYRDHPTYGITVSRNTWSVFVPETWQTSIQTDPRVTNVIPAEDEDLRDAVVLSSVDNAKSIVNSVRNLRGGTSLSFMYDKQLQMQEEMLQQQRGRSAEAENRRQEVLQELQQLRELKQQTEAAESIMLDDSVQFKNSNEFLSREDLNINAYNGINNDAFFMGNSVRGMAAEGKDASVPQFRFVLPEVKKSAPIKLEKLFEAPLEESQKKKAAPGDQPAIDHKGAEVLEQRSKLLGRKQSNLKQQADDLTRSTVTENEQVMDFEQPTAAFGLAAPTNRGGMAPPPNVQLLPNQALNGLGIILQNQVQDAAEGEIAEHLEQPVRSSGLLSLQFQIPVDGVRHDFIRTDGNASLTLKVRSQQAINYGLSGLWASICLIVALFIVASPSLGRMWLRLTVVIIMISLAGWLLLPAPFSYLAMFLGVLGAVSLCVTMTVKSFRNPAVSI